MLEMKILIVWFFLLFLLGGKVYCVVGDDFIEIVILLGGEFCMGSLFVDFKCGELVVKSVGVKLFVIDKYFVINENFWKFICVKKFKMEVEKFGWSFVFCIFVLEKV